MPRIVWRIDGWIERMAKCQWSNICSVYILKKLHPSRSVESLNLPKKLDGKMTKKVSYSEDSKESQIP